MCDVSLREGLTIMEMRMIRWMCVTEGRGDHSGGV